MNINVAIIAIDEITHGKQHASDLAEYTFLSNE